MRKRFIDILASERLLPIEELEEHASRALYSDLPLSQLLSETHGLSASLLRQLLKKHKFELLIGELLVESGLVRPHLMQAALHRQVSQGGTIGKNLMDIGAINSDTLTQSLCRQLNILEIKPAIEIAHDIEPRPTQSYLERNGVFPYMREGGKVVILMRDPFDNDTRHLLENFYHGTGITTAYTDNDTLQAFLLEWRRWDKESGQQRTNELERDLALTDETSASESSQSDPSHIFRYYIKEAIQHSASDVHIEPQEGSLRIRFAIDGALRTITHIPLSIAPRLINFIKTCCNLDTTIHRKPLDGRMSINHRGLKYNLRVSSYPCMHGENCVIRILSRESRVGKLEELSMSAHALATLRRSLNKAAGLVLVTGPTGSGKTTTLYTALQHLNQNDESHIITIEDPVEYRLPGITQGSIDERNGFGFASAISAIMRQNPDVIMVGEVRDEQTADSMIRAALSGHKVFSTLHTDNALSALNRLREMGIKPYLLTDTIDTIIAQRLTRSNCTHCSEQAQANPTSLLQLGLGSELASLPVMSATGEVNGAPCPHCGGTGHQGRTAIFEVLEMDTGLAEMIERQASTTEIQHYLNNEQKMISMKEDGLIKVFRGITTYEELLRTLPNPAQPVRPISELLQLAKSQKVMKKLVPNTAVARQLDAHTTTQHH